MIKLVKNLVHRRKTIHKISLGNSDIDALKNAMTFLSSNTNKLSHKIVKDLIKYRTHEDVSKYNFTDREVLAMMEVCFEAIIVMSDMIESDRYLLAIDEFRNLYFELSSMFGAFFLSSTDTATINFVNSHRTV